MGTTGVNYRIRSRVIKTTILLILSWCFLYFLVILSYTSNKVLFMYLLSSLAYLIIHTIPLTFVPVYSITVVFHKNIIRTNATLVCKSMNHLEESVERKQLILQDIDFLNFSWCQLWHVMKVSTFVKRECCLCRKLHGNDNRTVQYFFSCDYRVIIFSDLIDLWVIKL